MAGLPFFFFFFALFARSVHEGFGTAIKTPTCGAIERQFRKLLTRISSLSFRLQGNKKERKKGRESINVERKETLKDISLSRLVLYADSFDVVVSGTLIL